MAKEVTNLVALGQGYFHSKPEKPHLGSLALSRQQMRHPVFDVRPGKMHKSLPEWDRP